ncbi:twin-arginine translocation signal domain-containing protein [Aurantimonas sp. A2-1-M11]|uniref:twin-arginine translocation signal domain-containing protein n=1 Tax=Aurantimonas sp. A2-1-M11 TaxID=3113712 RepID=UPI002F926F44
MSDKDTGMKDAIKADRRAFLKFAGLGSVAGGAALVTGAPAEAEMTDQDTAGAGYRETDHVKTFYKTARF